MLLSLMYDESGLQFLEKYQQKMKQQQDKS